MASSGSTQSVSKFGMLSTEKPSPSVYPLATDTWTSAEELWNPEDGRDPPPGPSWGAVVGVGAS